MRHVVFVVPFAMDATMRFVRAAAKLPDVRLGLLSQQAPAQLDPDLMQCVAAFHRVGDALDADSLTAGVRSIASQMDGRVDRLIGILEPLQEALATTRERLGIPGLGSEAATCFRDKARMKTVLREHGLPCAKHALAHDRGAALAFGRACGYPLVCKPPAGAGAKNTFRVENETELADALAKLPPSARSPMLLEEFIRGREFSFDSVSLAGEHRFHSISCYHPTPLEVMENPWIQWCVLLPRDQSGPEFASIGDAGPRALHALGMETGMTHLEWFRREDGSIAISEVAARPPGAQFTSLIGYAHGVDMYRAWAELMSFDRFEVPARKYAVGAAFLRGKGSGRVVAMRGIQEAREKMGDLVVEANLPKVGQPGASSYEGEGYVIVRHEDTAAVQRALRDLVTTLEIELG